jgi:hypothetical protein
VVTYKLNKKAVYAVNAVSEKLDKYLKESVNTSSDVMALYTAASNEASNEQMAAFLLDLVGEVSYKVGDTTTVVTVAELTEALRVFQLANLLKDQDASPYALYITWCTRNGIE